MYNWEEGPYVDELDLWEDKIEEEYAEFIEETCKCVDKEDCECMTLIQFKDKAISDLADSYDPDDQREYEEMYA